MTTGLPTVSLYLGPSSLRPGRDACAVALLRKGSLVFVRESNMGVLDPTDFIKIGQHGLYRRDVTDAWNVTPQRQPKEDRRNPIAHAPRRNVQETTGGDVNLTRDIDVVRRAGKGRV